MLLEDRFDVRFPGRIDVAQNHSLQRRKPGVDRVLIQQGSQTRLDPQVSVIFDATILDVNAEEQLPVPLLVPAHVVVNVGDVGGIWLR